MDLNNKKILVLGMGREGQATAEYLAAKYPGCEVDVADKKDAANYPGSLAEWDLVLEWELLGNYNQINSINREE